MRPRLLLPCILAAGFVVATRLMPATAQTVTGDDIAPVMISELDVPGFHLIGESSPTPRRPDATNQQRTRIFFADNTSVADYTELIETVTVPTKYAVCLPFFPDNIAGGAVLGLNQDKPNFQVVGSLGVGDVDIFGTWSDLDAGANVWLTVGTEVFMRGQVTVYLDYRTHADHVDSAEMAQYARAQDDLLLRAAAAGTPIGAIAATPVPPASDPRPAICG